VEKDIRQNLAQARLSISGGRPMKLGPEDYERLFDPAFVQFVVLEDQKLKEAWEGPVSKVSHTLREGLERASKSELPPQLRAQVEAQLLGALQGLEPQKSLIDQAEFAGRLLEVIGHLAASTEISRPVPEDLLSAVVFPLLFIGAPEKFPTLDDEEKQALEQGMDPVFLYLDVVPYQMPAPEDGLLGAIPPDKVGVPHPALGNVAPLRLLTVDLEALGPALERFDAAKSREAFGRFCTQVGEQVGKTVAPGPSAQVIDEAGRVVGELKKIWDARSKGKVALRRLTEAEAASEPALSAVRKSIQGPRIILF
jgi:hypothetical protein